MSDAFVEQAILHWAPRFIQNGVDYGDFFRTTRQIDTWADWLPGWNRAADQHARIAIEAAQSDRMATAGQAWCRAAVYQHFGKFVWTLDQSMVEEATHRSVQEMLKAHAILDQTAERLVVPTEGGNAFANLRKPAGIDSPPYVVLIPGLDSTKEEFFPGDQLKAEPATA